METKNIKDRFNISPETYDAQRKFFIPCFDDYYGIGISLLAAMKCDVSSVLDLGAGTGLLSKYLFEKYPNATFTLVDVAEQMLEVAKLRFKDLDNFKYVQEDYSIALPQGEYDLIASALSVHHLDEAIKQALYSAAYDKLPVGGCLLNLDQFNVNSKKMNEAIDSFWYNQIKQSGISEKEQNLWLERRKLDKENSIAETVLLLRKIGFGHVECVYQYLKFGVILAVK